MTDTNRMESAKSSYLRDPVTNGNPREQALIRRWWHEQHDARGCLVWEYPLCGRWLDAIWFPESQDHGVEYSGRDLPKRFPLNDVVVVLCEAKVKLTPEVVGQALVHTFFVQRAGASIRHTTVFAETGAPDMVCAAADLGLELVLQARVT